MLILLTAVLLLASAAILFIKKSKLSIYLLGMCLSLMIFLCGVLIFIAKKGGYTKEILQFLYFSTSIKTWVQYLLISLNQIGYMIAVGRALFPAFLLQLALSYSVIPILRKHKLWVNIFPALSLAAYHPSIFRWLIAQKPWAQRFIVQASYTWILVYVAAALLLLVYEYFSIYPKFCRRPFASIVVCMFALSLLYILYCGQDPAQVYRFYSYDYLWNKGIGYLQYAPSVSGYYILVIANIVGGVLGFTSLVRYTHGVFQRDQNDVVLEKKFDAVRTGASIFVHGIKNQLLANRVIFKWATSELAREQPDYTRVAELITQLHENNEFLIARSEELYGTVKSQSVHLKPIDVSVLTENASRLFWKKYPDGLLEIDPLPDLELLADEGYFSEALYNLLINAWEANLAAGKRDPCRLTVHDERLYTILEVSDSGAGISYLNQKRIFEPFYTSKNSHHNWGMGLHHVRAIVKSHLGSIRVESSPGAGARFYILLPKYSGVAESGGISYERN